MIGRADRKPRHDKTVVEKPTVRIGKKGPTEFLVGEIGKQLDKRKVVKVKILKTALESVDAEEIAQKVAEATESNIVSLRGHTFTLHKPKKG
ncbi:MAG: YhbY family RNA-binding protein [Candidatus Bathyarchaeota archaeon]|nr:YhbY family RNA-binding protein [Candidatus Bathyarchaeota archaeon]